tara:strand:- start:22644 stop:24575 length:1932 start_codon:yes stop_codon:yes gene_type:complete
MADEVVFNVKSNLQQVAADTKEWESSLKGAAKEVEELTEDVKVQNSVLLDMDKELIKLEKAQAKLNGAWDPSNLTGKIKAQKAAIKDEKNGLKDLKTQLKNAKDESKKFTTAQKKQADAMKGSIGQFSMFGVSLNGIKKAFGKIGPAAKIMFGTIKAGIASTGIGILLLAFGALVTYFTSTKAGMDKVNVAIAKVSAAIDVIKDRISQFGAAIMKVFKGDFKGAAEDMRTAVKGIGTELKEEIKLAGELEIATQKLRDKNLDFIVMMANKKKAIAEARLIAKDETLSTEQRIAALKSAVNQENELLSVQLSNQAEKVRILEEQTAMGESSAEDEKALADQKVALIDMETASLNQRRTLKRELNTLENELAAEELERLQMIADEKQRIQDEADEAEALRKEEEAEAKAIAQEEADILKELQNENMLQGIEDLRERALAEIEIEYQAELKKYENYANFAAIKGELDKKYTAAKKALDKQELKFSEMTTKSKLKLAKGMFDDLANILGKESKAGKAAAIASTTISTFQGATSAFASLAPIPFVGPVLGGIAAAAAIVAGFKNIQAIRKGSTSTPSTPSPTSTSGSSGGGIDLPAVDEAGPAAEMMGGAFELGNVGNEPDPIKAFVVTDELTDSQDQLQDIRNRSTI